MSVDQKKKYIYKSEKKLSEKEEKLIQNLI